MLKQCIIIGGGPAGTAAALAAVDGGLGSVLLVERDAIGGTAPTAGAFRQSSFSREATPSPRIAETVVCRRVSGAGCWRTRTPWFRGSPARSRGNVETRGSRLPAGALDLSPRTKLRCSVEMGGVPPTPENIRDLWNDLLEFRDEFRIGVYKWGCHIDLGDPERPSLSRYWFNEKGHYHYINAIWS